MLGQWFHRRQVLWSAATVEPAGEAEIGCNADVHASVTMPVLLSSHQTDPAAFLCTLGSLRHHPGANLLHTAVEVATRYVGSH